MFSKLFGKRILMGRRFHQVFFFWIPPLGCLGSGMLNVLPYFSQSYGKTPTWASILIL